MSAAYRRDAVTTVVFKLSPASAAQAANSVTLQADIMTFFDVTLVLPIFPNINPLIFRTRLCYKTNQQRYKGAAICVTGKTLCTLFSQCEKHGYCISWRKGAKTQVRLLTYIKVYEAQRGWDCVVECRSKDANFIKYVITYFSFANSHKSYLNNNLQTIA